MKKRMYQNVAAIYFRENSSIFLFVVVLFLMGVIFGAVVVNSLSFTQKEDLFSYLSQFFGQVSDGKVAAANDLFRQSFYHNIKFIGLMWVLGISIIGLPVILILLFIKGMVVGFTVGFLVNQMGWNGFLLAFVSILPQNLIIIPIFIIIAAVSISFSLRMVQMQFMKKYSQPILPLFRRYLTALVVAIILLAVSSAVEAYLSPDLMKTVVHTIK
ncbi:MULTISPECIES: stage II sporulation protein M [unclassified Bacillus (in: firmicutes)]|uniref:stage II sporulation protein M n=1 Tax=unclassified Bacillus (in: firmicutes) TaxID=185979 RepID=UPI0008EDAE3E|nr:MULTISPECIES: stage II sporulation protein M [unclassified Bacillus (in: firmicutes)]SFA97662.1 stage II sporulation protein M [Bacillus sp. UNCCL13]SFQ80591.1 stage II sporulation protein M [Bacillus sp. cl95]